MARLSFSHFRLVVFHLFCWFRNAALDKKRNKYVNRVVRVRVVAAGTSGLAWYITPTWTHRRKMGDSTSTQTVTKSLAEQNQTVATKWPWPPRSLLRLCAMFAIWTIYDGLGAADRYILCDILQSIEYRWPARSQSKYQLHCTQTTLREFSLFS